MTDFAWSAFKEFCEHYRKKIDEWSSLSGELTELQKKAALDAKTPSYSFETAVVYNRDLDKIQKDDDIKLIVIGDNPGKDEQLLKNNRYLVGQAGKIGEGFFRRNAELGIDFRKNVIILNKTPVHSAKTAQLKKIQSLGGKKIQELILESQLWMAQRTAKLQQELGAELWLVGYSELKEKGIFSAYRDELKSQYIQNGNFIDDWEKVFVFQHFSMNRFTIDLASFESQLAERNVPLIQKIHELGKLHKNEIFMEI